MLLLRPKKKGKTKQKKHHILLEQLTLQIHFFEVYTYEVYTYLCLCIMHKYILSYVHVNGKDLTVKIIAPMAEINDASYNTFWHSYPFEAI